MPLELAKCGCPLRLVVLYLKETSVASELFLQELSEKGRNFSFQCCSSIPCSCTASSARFYSHGPAAFSSLTQFAALSCGLLIQSQDPQNLG